MDMPPTTGKIERLIIPHELQAIIKNIWRIRVHEHPVKIIPDGTLHLFIFSKKQLLLEANNICKKYDTSFLKGLGKTIYTVKSNSEFDFLLCSIYPWVGTTLIDISIDQLVGEQNSFPFLQNHYSRLGVFSPLNPAPLFTFLKEKSPRTNQRNIKKAYFQIMENGGNFKVAKIASDYCFSESGFRKKFYQYIGISPKKLAKFSRILKTIRQFHKGHIGNLTFLAYQLGYYDQAHFIREFRQVMHCTPRQYFGDMDANFVQFQIQKGIFSKKFKV